MRAHLPGDQALMLQDVRQGSRPSRHMRVHVNPEEEARAVKDALEAYPRCTEPGCRKPSKTVILAPSGEVLFILCGDCEKHHAVHDSLVMKVRS